MELDEFIRETLGQILTGVRAAQAEEGGMDVNASLPGVGSESHLISGGTYGLFTRVDFDVAISAEKTGEGKASIKVFGLGAEGGGGTKSIAANRVTFSVPVRLPDGDTSRRDREKAMISEANRNAARRSSGSF